MGSIVRQVGDTTACRQALRRWLVREGQAHLVPRLADLSRTLGLPYARTTICLARSRWGNCARTGVIALNARLLLLAPPSWTMSSRTTSATPAS